MGILYREAASALAMAATPGSLQAIWAASVVDAVGISSVYGKFTALYSRHLAKASGLE